MLLWEKAFIPPAEIGRGVLPARFAWMLSVALIAAVLVALVLQGLSWPILLAFSLLSVLLLRLLVLDLSYLILPDIYTLPLLVIGLFLPWMSGLHDTWWWSITGAGLLFSVHYGLALLLMFLTKGKGGLGGGDIKLAAALGAWFGPVLGILLIAVACGASLIPAALFPKREVPYGMGLTLGALALLYLVFLPEVR